MKDYLSICLSIYLPVYTLIYLNYVHMQFLTSFCQLCLAFF